MCASFLAIRDLEIAKAEAEVKFRIEEAKLAAEEKFIALSEPGLSEAGSRRSASKVVVREKISASCPQERNFEQYIQVDKEMLERGLKLLFLSLCIVNLVRLKQNL